MYKNERCLIFDESGNLGPSGRYFVIACIDTMQAKSVHNIMKKKIKDADTLFPSMKRGHANEIKAKDAYPCVKYHILESICKKDISISYIVVDLNYVKPRLLLDKNILYNFVSNILISKLIEKSDEGSKINIIFDSHSTKVASKNSLSDYIISQIVYERNLDVHINFEYKNSDASDAYVIQAADYVANAIFSKYEYGNDLYYAVIRSKVNKIQTFPYAKFGR